MLVAGKRCKNITFFPLETKPTFICDKDVQPQLQLVYLLASFALGRKPVYFAPDNDCKNEPDTAPSCSKTISCASR